MKNIVKSRFLIFILIITTIFFFNFFYSKSSHTLINKKNALSYDLICIQEECDFFKGQLGEKEKELENLQEHYNITTQELTRIQHLYYERESNYYWVLSELTKAENTQDLESRVDCLKISEEGLKKTTIELGNSLIDLKADEKVMEGKIENINTDINKTNSEINLLENNAATISANISLIDADLESTKAKIPIFVLEGLICSLTLFLLVTTLKNLTNLIRGS